MESSTNVDITWAGIGREGHFEGANTLSLISSLFAFSSSANASFMP